MRSFLLLFVLTSTSIALASPHVDGTYLTGKITDIFTKKPIAGVKVTLRVGEIVFSPQGETDKDGVYRIESPPMNDEVNAFLAVAGSIPELRQLGRFEDGENVRDFKLDRSRQVRVLVLDAETKKPVEGVGVGGFALPFPAGTTDANGHVTLTGSAERETTAFSLYAKKDGCFGTSRSVRLRVGNTPYDVEQTLVVGQECRVDVTASEGDAALPRTSVLLTIDAKNRAQIDLPRFLPFELPSGVSLLDFGENVTTLDDAGHGVFAGLPPLPYSQVEIVANGVRVRGAIEPFKNTGESRDVHLTVPPLDRSATLTLAVTLNGEPTRALVRWRQKECEGYGEFRPPEATSFGGLPVGSVEILVREMQYHEEKSIVVVAAPNRVVQHEFAFTNDGKHVRGVVLDQKGRVVPGVHLRITEVAERETPASLEGDADQEGKFELLMPGTAKAGFITVVDPRFDESGIEARGGEMDAIVTAMTKSPGN